MEFSSYFSVLAFLSQFISVILGLEGLLNTGRITVLMKASYILVNYKSTFKKTQKWFTSLSCRREFKRFRSMNLRMWNRNQYYGFYLRDYWKCIVQIRFSLECNFWTYLSYVFSTTMLHISWLYYTSSDIENFMELLEELFAGSRI